MMFWIVLFLGLGLVVLYYSRHQPFPEISGRFALLLLVAGGMLWLSTTAPRETGESVPAVVATVVGGAAVVIGVIQMSMLKNDVIVAPFGGVLLCMGAISLMVERWAGMEQTERFIRHSLTSGHAGNLPCIQGPSDWGAGDLMVEIRLETGPARPDSWA